MLAVPARTDRLFVCVVGAPGAGKSHLVRQLRDSFGAADWQPFMAGRAPYLRRHNVVLLGRYVDYHTRTGSASDKKFMDGADRIVPGPGTKAVNKAFQAFAQDGVDLILCDSVRPAVFNKNTLQAARAAGYQVGVIVLPRPALAVAQARWKQPPGGTSLLERAKSLQEWAKWGEDDGQGLWFKKWLKDGEYVVAVDYDEALEHVKLQMHIAQWRVMVS